MQELSLKWKDKKNVQKKEKPKEMDISNLSNKEFKEMVIKMLTKLESDIEKPRGRKCSKEPTRSEEYNNWNEKHIRKKTKHIRRN